MKRFLYRVEKWVEKDFQTNETVARLLPLPPWIRHCECLSQRSLTIFIEIRNLTVTAKFPLSDLELEMCIREWRHHSLLTATFNSYGNRYISTPTKSILLNRSTKKSVQLITFTRRPSTLQIDPLVQIDPLKASGKMGEI